MWVTIKSWWRYSRTIFINVLAALSLVLADIIGFLIGLDWNIVLSPRAAFYTAMAFNIVNIGLRYITTGPVGGKDVPVGETDTVLKVSGEGGPDVSVVVDKKE